MAQIIKSFSLLIFLLFSLTSSAQEADQGDTAGDDKAFSWPLEFEAAGESVVTLYQPQLESFKDNILEGRMAITIKQKEKDLLFGAVWFEATMSTDIENRTAYLDRIHIGKTHFPDIVDEDKNIMIAATLSTEIESWNIEMSLDRILASLAEVEGLKHLSDNINNDAPKIYFRNSPAILLMIDGDPITKTDEKSKLEYIVNTPFFIVKDSKSDDYYINGGPFWYTSREIMTGWEETKKVPSQVKKFAESQNTSEGSDSVANSYSEAPELIVETKAAELILVDGEIDYKPIEGTGLLYVANTESDIIMDINSQKHYLLLAGRWYSSRSLEDGDWKFAEPDELPEDFQNIPAESEMESIRASIPGTPEAQTALLEQSIPQTATIDRKTATVEVTFDGDPQFEKIEGTTMSYAVNTEKTVVIIDNVFYCIDNGVWFEASDATGPWEVSTERPGEVDDIPPESPVYNIKYTYIYESTPEVVHVGYLPGYTHSYVYGGVVVYGTGYHYRPWYGHYYYPRPVTWGYGVHYSPYGGWGFSVGISFGWIGWGFHPYGMGYWGHRGYYGGYRHGYRRGYHHGARAGYRAGYNAGRRNSNRNVYNNRNSGVRNTSNRARTNNVNNKARSTNKSNNMYAGRGGNVYQRNNSSGNFQNKSNNRQSQSRPSQSQNQQLNRSHQTRSQGTQNYNRSSQHRSSGARAGGASRGGGGRRR